MGKYLWIDCDPGVDDAAAILLAARSKKYKLAGISAVSGNVSHDYTFENARKLAEFAGINVPVFSGAKKPLLREPVTAEFVHGEDGLGGAVLPEPSAAPEEKKAWDALYEAVCKYGDELEVCAVGPLTNIAIALIKHPDLAQKLPRIIIMGGSATEGNTTAAAEFNIYVDPEAAERVFQSGICVVMFGLDATMKSYLTDKDLDRLKSFGSPQTEFLHSCLQILYEYGEEYSLPGVSLHDACTVLYLEKPELFTLKPAWAAVETEGEITRGKTVTDIYSDKKYEPKNIEIALDVDREGFAELFLNIIGEYH